MVLGVLFQLMAMHSLCFLARTMPFSVMQIADEFSHYGIEPLDIALHSDLYLKNWNGSFAPPVRQYAMPLQQLHPPTETALPMRRANVQLQLQPEPGVLEVASMSVSDAPGMLSSIDIDKPQPKFTDIPLIRVSTGQVPPGGLLHAGGQARPGVSRGSGQPGRAPAGAPSTLSLCRHPSACICINWASLCARNRRCISLQTETLHNSMDFSIYCSVFQA